MTGGQSRERCVESLGCSELSCHSVPSHFSAFPPLGLILCADEVLKHDYNGYGVKFNNARQLME